MWYQSIADLFLKSEGDLNSLFIFGHILMMLIFFFFYFFF